MEFIINLVQTFLDIILHLDQHLADWTARMGSGVLVLLFAIIFCETGLVIMPFLPGDSLLFAVGAICALPGSGLEIVPTMLLLLAAAILGDATNYFIGRKIGPVVFNRPSSRFLKKQHLDRTHAFYLKHGGKAVFLARFLPIVRTFAPFVAGVGKMPFSRYAFFNVAGALTWICGFLLAGYVFGNIPSVKTNFHIVILAIIGVSVMPIAIEWWRIRRSVSASQSH